MSYKALFDLCDSDKDNMVSLAEFQRGIQTVITLSSPVVEMLYNLMDKHRNKLINMEQFCDVLKAQQLQVPNITDNFKWEMAMVEELKKWIVKENQHPEEAFKRFDKDFDGQISKDDLKLGLQNNLRIPSFQINDTKLERLFRLLDSFKAGHI